MGTPFCFVIMGFGKKTDFGSKKPRVLDLDKTYEGIIKPAVISAGLRCVRSDEVQQSGIIDSRMYEMLLRADLVIADISTANPNAIYELGIRHALRPFSTIVIKEVDGMFHFDLNHLATLQYKHLGEDIGHTEALQKTTQLAGLIRAILAKPDTDSPVYTYLTTLKQPMMSSDELESVVKRAEKGLPEGVGALVAAGRAAADASRHAEARDLFQRACDLQGVVDGPNAIDPFVVQQLALHTYKAKEPDAARALSAALAIIERLRPDESIDPETLGIGGAIRKRLWEADKSAHAHLDAAIDHYGRGFEVKRDYYNGENYALCLDLRAARQAEPAEAAYDRMTARKARQRVQQSLAAILAEPDVNERSDYHWALATMSNVARALRATAVADEYEERFRALKRPGWEVETFESGKRYATELAG